MLLDTGASACFIDQECVEKISDIKVVSADKCTRLFMTANKRRLQVLGMTTLLCSISTLRVLCLPMFIVKDLACSIVLGRDFFKLLGIRLMVPKTSRTDAASEDQSSDYLPLEERPPHEQDLGAAPAVSPTSHLCFIDGSSVREDALFVKEPMHHTMASESADSEHPIGVDAGATREPDIVSSSKITFADVVYASLTKNDGSGPEIRDCQCEEDRIFSIHDGELLCEVYEEPDIEELGMPKNTLDMVKDLRIRAILSKFPNVTTSKLSSVPCSVDYHNIDLIDGAAPYKRTYYKVGPKEREFMEATIKELIELGVIEHSRSPWGSPVVLVKKKDGTFRMCIDYRKLNELTKSEIYPLPFIEEIIDKMQGKKVFSKFDLKSGYWQILMALADIEKTAFVTHMGAFQWKRMPFGLKNATTTFQRIMRRVLSGLEYCCEVHVDDIFVFSENEEEHLKHIELIMERLNEAKLIVNLCKCEFMKSELVFIGHTFNAKGIAPDPSKLDAIRNMRPPKDVTGVRAFLGLMNFYRRFVEGFARIAVPLVRLTVKGVVFRWEQAHQEAFEKLRDALLTTNLLQHPDFSRPFKVTTDASDYAVGGTLSQAYDQGADLPVAFYSRKLDSAQQNYDIVEKECLAIIESVKQWRHYLSHDRFMIETDHKPLTWLHSLKDPSRRQVRWSVLLQEFDYDIKYKPGKSNVVSDALSRLWSIRDDMNNWQEFEKFLVYFVTHKVHDPEAIADGRLTRSMKGRITKMAQHMSIDEHGVLSHKGRPVPNATERKEIVEKMHLLGHYGIEPTMLRILEQYWWPGMYDYVKDAIKNCSQCARFNDATGGTMVKGVPQHSVTKGVFDVVAVDYMGPLPETPRGNKYLLQFDDQLSDYVEWFPAKENTDDVMAEHFVNDVIARYGPPTHLLSDRGKEFCNKIVNAISDVAGTIRKVTSGYHPRTNGRCEKRNHLLIQVVRKFAAQDPKNWDLWMPFALLADRSRPRVATGYSPMYLMFGRESVLFADYRMASDEDNDSAEAILNRIKHIHKLVEIVHPELSNRMIKKARKAKAALSKIAALEPGTFVMVKRKDYEKVPKLQPRYDGVYKVVNRTENGDYKVEVLRGKVYPLPVHPDRLRVIGKELAMRLLVDPEFRPEVDAADDEIYEVEAIKSHKVMARKGLMYEIKWKGYADTTWEPESSIIKGDEILKEYWQKAHAKTNDAPVQATTRQGITIDDIFNEPVSLMLPDDVLEECTLHIRPKPSRLLEEWIKATLVELDVELLPFQTRAMFCKRTIAEVPDENMKDHVGGVWINAPWSCVDKVLEWCRGHSLTKKLCMLLPEWIDDVQFCKLCPHVRICGEKNIPIPASELFVWPNGEKHTVGWTCRLIECEITL